jgi:hypothetical protein
MHTTCNDIFNLRLHERTTRYPLAYGRYKLVEARHWLNRAGRNIDLMMKDFDNLYRKRTYLGCTVDDRSTWLKHTPLDVAEGLGYEVVPGIDALLGDGVSLITVNNIKAKVLPEINQLVVNCDQVRNQISKNIKVEYRCWQQQNSLVKPLTIKAVTIIDEILNTSGL